MWSKSKSMSILGDCLHASLSYQASLSYSSFYMSVRNFRYISVVIMGRGVSCGGGQSSLGYLFGGGEEPNPTSKPVRTEAPTSELAVDRDAPSKPASAPAAMVGQTADVAGGQNSNNYFRPDGQNCGNFITDRPSTKVHAAPGGGSSLGYLFGGGESNSK